MGIQQVKLLLNIKKQKDNILRSKQLKLFKNEI